MKNKENQELTEFQIEWINGCTKYGTWNINKETGLIDVHGDFRCSYQGIKDFNGVKFGYVKGCFDCSHNQLTSIVGAPKSVRVFICNNNELTSLEGCPQEITDMQVFDCSHNKLTNLIGAPKIIKAGLNCSNNLIVSLEGAPAHSNYGFNYFENNPVSESILAEIYDIMKDGNITYQDALDVAKNQIVDFYSKKMNDDLEELSKLVK